MSKSTNTVVIGEQTKRIVEMSQSTFIFPNLDKIYEMLQSTDDLRSLFPESFLFVDYLKKLYEFSDKSSALDAFELIFHTIVTDGNLMEDEEKMFDEDGMDDDRKCAEILYNNFDVLHGMWTKEHSKTISKKK